MFFSIIIPTYNREKLIGRAIKSVLNQSFKDFEIIVIDDGSEDRTEHVVNSFKDERIKYIYQENAERSVARNNGIKHAKGEWVCFLDSDDIYLLDHLEKLHAFIQENNLNEALLVSGHWIEENGERRKHLQIDTNKNLLKEIWTKFILMNSVCVSKAILIKNLFNPEYKIWEDTHLWLRVAAQYPVFQLNDFTCVQFVHEESSVVRGMNIVKLNLVYQYIEAVNNLRSEHGEIVGRYLTPNDYRMYIDLKYRMFLYRSRQNRQIRIALNIWLKAFINKPSFYLIKEFIKLWLNYFKITLKRG
jgi:glycosyltransferase involved in cell wall biosynthesis